MVVQAIHISLVNVSLPQLNFNWTGDIVISFEGSEWFLAIAVVVAVLVFAATTRR